MEEIALEVGGTPEEALAALAAEAEAWGAAWEGRARGGRLAVPSVFGLRRGTVAGEVEVDERVGGSRLRFRPGRTDLAVHRPAVALLLLAGAAGLVTVAWPFFPRLLPLLPAAVLVALSGWWLVVSRLRTAGPRELLEAARERLARAAGGS